MSNDSNKKGKAINPEVIWFTPSGIGQVVADLDENGAVDIRVEDPTFAGPPYSVLLGLGLQKDGPICYGTLDSLKPGDYFYAKVHPWERWFDIRLKAQDLPNQKVKIEFHVTSHEFVGPTRSPMPKPTKSPTTVVSIRPLNSVDASGRHIDEVPGIDPKAIQILAKGGIESLAALASAVAADVAQMLNISEVKAMGLIHEAGRVLEKPKK